MDGNFKDILSVEASQIIESDLSELQGQIYERIE